MKGEEKGREINNLLLRQINEQQTFGTSLASRVGSSAAPPPK